MSSPPYDYEEGFASRSQEVDNSTQMAQFVFAKPIPHFHSSIAFLTGSSPLEYLECYGFYGKLLEWQSTTMERMDRKVIMHNTRVHNNKYI